MRQPLLVLVACVLALAACSEADSPIAPEEVRHAAAPEGAALSGTTPAYRAVDLGTLGGCCSVAHAINDADQIVGWSTTPSGERRAVLWENGAIRDLGALEGTMWSSVQSEANDINQQGQVVGWSTSANGRQRPFLWQDGTMIELPGSLGGQIVIATGINDLGQVVGSSTIGNGTNPQAFLWEDGVMTGLGVLGGCCSQALDINNAGQVVGHSNSRAFLWSDGGMTQLDGLGDCCADVAFAIDGSGRIVGRSLSSQFGIRAVLWSDEGIEDLGTLGGNTSTARGISEAGRIVGGSRTADQRNHGFVWEDGVMTELLPVWGDRAAAESSNATGLVVGWSLAVVGSDPDAFPTLEQRATLWIPSTLVEVALARAAAAIASLEEEGTLNHGQARSLLGKLNAAEAAIERGNTQAAVNQLEAFVREVEALVRGGVLTPEQGQTLITEAQAAIDATGGST